MANHILASAVLLSTIEQANQAISFKNRYPALFQLGQIQYAIDSGTFKQWQTIERNLQQWLSIAPRSTKKNCQPHRCCPICMTTGKTVEDGAEHDLQNGYSKV